MQIWAKVYEKKHKVKDIIVESQDPELTRTKKVFKLLEEVCYNFDLQVPIWLESNIKDFKCYSKTRFTKDCFIEAVDFDYLEFQVIEED